MQRDKLYPCPACDGALSVTAISCPKCGYRKPLLERYPLCLAAKAGGGLIKDTLQPIWARLPSLERVVEILMVPLLLPWYPLFKWKEKERIKQIYEQEVWTLERVCALMFVSIYWLFGSVVTLVTVLTALFAALAGAAWMLGRLFGIN